MLDNELRSWNVHRGLANDIGAPYATNTTDIINQQILICHILLKIHAFIVE